MLEKIIKYLRERPNFNIIIKENGEDKIIPANKHILKAMSKYFETYFSTERTKEENKQVTFNDKKYDIVKKLGIPLHEREERMRERIASTQDRSKLTILCINRIADILSDEEHFISKDVPGSEVITGRNVVDACMKLGNKKIDLLIMHVTDDEGVLDSIGARKLLAQRFNQSMYGIVLLSNGWWSNTDVKSAKEHWAEGFRKAGFNDSRSYAA